MNAPPIQPLDELFLQFVRLARRAGLEGDAAWLGGVLGVLLIFTAALMTFFSLARLVSPFAFEDLRASYPVARILTPALVFALTWIRFRRWSVGAAIAAAEARHSSRDAILVLALVNVAFVAALALNVLAR